MGPRAGIGIWGHVLELENGDPYRERQISVLDRVRVKATKMAHHSNCPIWETLASRRKLSRLCALAKRTRENGRERI